MSLASLIDAIPQDKLKSLCEPFADRTTPELLIAAQGQPIPSLIPVITTVIYSIVFIAVGIWRFSREEF